MRDTTGGVSVGIGTDVKVVAGRCEALRSISEEMLGKSSGYRVSVLGARFSIDVMDGSSISLLARGLETATEGAASLTESRPAKTLSGCSGPQASDLPKGRMDGRSKTVYNEGVCGRCGSESSKAKPKGENGRLKRKGAVPLGCWACHSGCENMVNAPDGVPDRPSRGAEEELRSELND